MRKKISIRALLNFILVILFISLFYLSFVVYQQTNNLIMTNHLVTHTYRVIEVADAALYHLNLATSKQRGYLLTHNTEYKKLYLKSILALKTDFKTLSQLTQDNPKQQERLRNFSEYLNEREQFLKETVVLFETKGLAVAQQKLNGHQEFFSFNKVNDIASKIIHEERRLLQERNQEMVTASKETIRITIMGEIISLVAIFMGFLLFNHQLSLRTKAEKKLYHLAYYLPLTGLPNRALLTKKLDEAISIAKDRNHAIAVLFVNFDNFKNINDSFGFDIGDEVLQLIARRLEEYTYKNNLFLLSHLGGNDFVILVANMNSFDILLIVNNILNLVEEEIQIKNQKN